MMETEQHFVNRSAWLRAAVLGVNDGILSTTSLVIGVAAASSSRSPISFKKTSANKWINN